VIVAVKGEWYGTVQKRDVREPIVRQPGEDQTMQPALWLLIGVMALLGETLHKRLFRFRWVLLRCLKVIRPGRSAAPFYRCIEA